MQRYDFLKSVAKHSGDALVVCTGWGAREWWALCPSDGNLKTRTLGLVSSIAAGLALALPHRKVIAIDGDGAFLMNLCGLPTVALQNPSNLIHLLFDNEVYEASGGTATASRIT
ncbi:MAG TPA: thiamine pyrophosphate-dependent enzyme, partial [Candidatus Udaeobacter sp.]|nr:thiamine pyrophosphate-dependent enzyme [Candidatus Udaeobacter sp.]